MAGRTRDRYKKSILTLGGRPRLRGTAGVDALLPVAEEADFLFLLPLGLPRPRFMGGFSADSAVPGTSGWMLGDSDVNERGGEWIKRSTFRNVLG